MSEVRLTLTVLKESFAVCRLEPTAPYPEWGYGSSFVSVTRTPEELSIVCEDIYPPNRIECERDWKCFRIQGPLGFTQVGILSSLLSPLADANISIFVISTFDTDYLMVKAKDLEAAISVLANEGHWISRNQ